MSVTDVLSALAWSLAGFMVGYTVCLVTANPPTFGDEPAHQEDPVYTRRRNSNRIIGWAVVLMSLVTVASLAYSNHAQRAIIDCQTAVNGRLVGAISTRAVIADQDREAINDLITAIAKGSSGNVKAYAAIRKASEGVVTAGASRESLDELTRTIAESYTAAGPVDKTQAHALQKYIASIEESKLARAKAGLPAPEDYQCGN